jgi:hypothetical protein
MNVAQKVTADYNPHTMAAIVRELEGAINAQQATLADIVTELLFQKGLPQDLQQGASPKFKGLTLTDPLPIASGGTGLSAISPIAWTPTLGGNATYAFNTGLYIQLGKLVIARGRIQVTTLGTGSATVISGLPVAADNTSMFYPVTVDFYNTIASNVVQLTGQVNNNASTITLYSALAAAAAVSSANAIFGNGATVYFNAVYFTA